MKQTFELFIAILSMLLQDIIWFSFVAACLSSFLSCFGLSKTRLSSLYWFNFRVCVFIQFIAFYSSSSRTKELGTYIVVLRISSISHVAFLVYARYKFNDTTHFSNSINNKLSVM